MDPNANPTVAPVKKPSLGQRIKRFFSGKSSKTTGATGEVVHEEKHEVKETHEIKDKNIAVTGTQAHGQAIVPPGPVLVPAVMIPVVGAPQQNAAFLPPPQPMPTQQLPPQQPVMSPGLNTEKQAFGSIIESKPIGVAQVYQQQAIVGPAPVPVQQMPQPQMLTQPPPIQPVIQPIPTTIAAPTLAPAPVPVANQGLYQPVGEILPPPVTLSVMGPVNQPPIVTETKATVVETRPMVAGGGVPMESGGVVYNAPVIQPNQGVYIEQGQQQMAPHLRNIVEITGTQPPDPLVPRDTVIGPAVKTNPVFMENLPNLRNDKEYISRHLAEDNPAKPTPFHQMQEFGKIPNPSYAGGKPFFVDMLYNPDPLVPLSQYNDTQMHVPLQVIGQKNAELVQINKMNEVQIKEHKDAMRSDRI